MALSYVCRPTNAVTVVVVTVLYVMWFLLEPVAALLAAPRQRPVLVGLVAVVSILFHWRAARAPSVHMWNVGPPDVDEAPARVWDWKDAQFLRSFHKSHR